jgi:tRNA-splicing ligase RtcB
VGRKIWEIPKEFRPDMRVDARVFASDELMEQIRRDRSLEQLINVSTLPGLAAPVMGMPDMHEGYGFPVGGVAATRYPDGVISPGGIGFDINCGVRLLASSLRREEVEPSLGALLHEISRSVPAGYGRGSRELAFSGPKLDRLLEEGVPLLVRKYGIGWEEDLPFIESEGAIPGARASEVSDRAKHRGGDQLGTLGGGNHFLEIQYVEEIYDRELASAFGISDVGQVTVLIHTGSRGLGHQVCTDYVKRMDAVMHQYGIHVPDRQLACAPLESREGKAYFAAMCAAANFAFCNRHVIAHRVRLAFEYILRGSYGDRAGGLRTVYDVAHNIAKLERYGDEVLCVHRKGATRAFGPSAEELPEPYRGFGQPVFIPGSMGTHSYVLAGRDEAKELSLASTCHGAGRAMSRAAAKRRVHGGELRRELAEHGILVEGASNKELAEEAPEAYKDVDLVVDVVHNAGIASKVARLRPIAVRKG